MLITVVAHNIRSTHNVGSILRTADGFGVSKVYMTGYTPYPARLGDTRLPHIRDKVTQQIHKTALGAELTVPNEHRDNIAQLLKQLASDGYDIVALEQSPTSILLPNFRPQTTKLALLLGEEVNGVPPDVLALCRVAVEIPMRGQKESFNVSVAAGIALYALTTLQ